MQAMFQLLFVQLFQTVCRIIRCHNKMTHKVFVSLQKPPQDRGTHHWPNSNMFMCISKLAVAWHCSRSLMLSFPQLSPLPIQPNTACCHIIFFIVNVVLFCFFFSSLLLLSAFLRRSSFFTISSCTKRDGSIQEKAWCSKSIESRGLNNRTVNHCWVTLSWCFFCRTIGCQRQRSVTFCLKSSRRSAPRRTLKRSASLRFENQSN